MSVKYICQYCKSTIGTVDSSDVSELQLGWHFLTPAERQHIISYEANGDMVARITCEFCDEAIRRHPELMNPLQ